MEKSTHAIYRLIIGNQYADFDTLNGASFERALTQAAKSIGFPELYFSPEIRLPLRVQASRKTPVGESSTLVCGQVTLLAPQSVVIG